MPTVEEVVERLLKGDHLDLGILSNPELRRLGQLVEAALEQAIVYCSSVKRERWGASADAAGHSFTIVSKLARRRWDRSCLRRSM